MIPRRSVLSTLAALALAALGLAATSTGARAAKPSGGGGVLAGTVYFNSVGQVHAMNPDGSGKTALPVRGNSLPGRLPHGGHRWFLQVRQVDGTYPNGDFRFELFAVRGDGALELQLTDDPSLQLTPLSSWHWAPGETSGAAVIGGFARRWDPAAGQVLADSIGIYTATVLFDDTGSATGLQAPPEFLVSVGAVNGSVDSRTGFDFSPDRSQVVVDHRAGDALRIVDVATGASRTLVTGVSQYPTWSPDGKLIAFGHQSAKFPNGAIQVIAPDGSGRKTLAKPGSSMSVNNPHWAPDSAHLIYSQRPAEAGQAHQYDVFRVSTSGASTNLTADLAAGAGPLGWR